MADLAGETKEGLARLEYNRRLATNDKAGLLGRRGVFPMHHRLFYQYLRWVLAELSPYASPLPLHWTQGEEYDRHVSYFGKPWGVSKVEFYLADLLGSTFTRIFGSAATVDDYKYVASILASTNLPPETVPVTMVKATLWLQEQIAKFHATQPEANRHKSSALEPVATSQLLPAAAAAYSPWLPLLDSRLTLPDFYTFLHACGLLTPDGQLTPLGQGQGLGKARRAPWVGALRALLEARLLDSNIAAVCRALAVPDGRLQVELADNSLLVPSKKAETYQQVATSILRAQGLLR